MFIWWYVPLALIGGFLALFYNEWCKGRWMNNPELVTLWSKAIYAQAVRNNPVRYSTSESSIILKQGDSRRIVEAWEDGLFIYVKHDDGSVSSQRDSIVARLYVKSQLNTA